MGAKRNGAGNVFPKSSILVSLSETSVSNLGRMRRLRNASRLAKTVSSEPAPPATKSKTAGDSFAFAAASRSSGGMGVVAVSPERPRENISS